MDKWYLYMIRCKDGSLYTGVTNDYVKRFEIQKSGKGSKYVRKKGFVRAEYLIEAGTKSEACKLEYKIKQFKKSEKENLILNDQDNLIKHENCKV